MAHANPTLAGSGALQRPRYFDRQQLSAADLNLSLDYLRARLRRHNRFLHGWGVVCGAQVLSTSDLWTVRITEGYVVTPHGDEIYIPATVEYNIRPGIEDCWGTPDDCPDPESVPPASSLRIIRANIDPGGRDPRSNYNLEWVDICLLEELNLNGFALQHTLNPGTPAQTVATYYVFREAGVLPRGSVIRVHSGSRLNHDDPEPGFIHRYVADDAELGNWQLNNAGDTLRVLNPAGAVLDIRSFLSGSLVPIDGNAAYLVVYPDETLECPQPGLPLDCLPPGSNYQFSRIGEGYRLAILCDLPASHRVEGLSCDQLEKVVCEKAHVPVPTSPLEEDNGVVLATIQVLENRIVIVDDLSDRHQLISESLLLNYLHCQCQEETPIPTTPPTVISQPTTPSTPPTTPTFITIFTRPTIFSDFTLLTRPTLFTNLTEFTLLTLFSEFSDFSRFSVFSDFSRFSVFSDFSRFSEFSDFSRFSAFSEIFSLEPGIDLDPNVFDLDFGRSQPVTAIPGIGRVREEQLMTMGVTNLVEFVSMPSQVAAETMGISEVRVADLQTQARELMKRGDR